MPHLVLLLLTIREDAESSKNAVAGGLLSFLSTYIFCGFLCLLVDVLNTLTKLCKTLQLRDLLFSQVKPKIVLAIGEIKGMKTIAGPTLKAFETNCTVTQQGESFTAVWKLNDSNIELKCTKTMKDKFVSSKDQFLQSLVDNLEHRIGKYSDDGNVLNALSELTDPKSLCSTSTETTLGLVGIVTKWFAKLSTQSSDVSDSDDAELACQTPVFDEDSLLQELID